MAPWPLCRKRFRLKELQPSFTDATKWADDLSGVWYSVIFAASRLRRESDGLFSLCRPSPAPESAFELKEAPVSQLRGKKSDVRVTLNSAPIRNPLRSGNANVERDWRCDVVL
ncbi:hypothetical protein HZ326_20011 [Fusarium oxysporum f. sp. albedinis]|nr:hypothetical protein HZ326_20011 [Fusarium oxysporum f. sp. albedinis]